MIKSTRAAAIWLNLFLWCAAVAVVTNGAYSSSAVNLIFWHIVTLNHSSFGICSADQTWRLIPDSTSSSWIWANFFTTFSQPFLLKQSWCMTCASQLWLGALELTWQRNDALWPIVPSCPWKKNLRSNWLIWHWLVSSCVTSAWNHRHNKGWLRGWPLRVTACPAQALRSQRGAPPGLSFFALLMELLLSLLGTKGER